MYQFHGWFRLLDTVGETFDSSPLYQGMKELSAILDQFEGSVNTVAELKGLNGEYFLWIHGFTNRRLFPGPAGTVDTVLDFLSRRLPGSYGIMYERDDEMVEPPGGNAFRVRVLARGEVTERADPFLSPCVPTIEEI